MAIAFSFTQKIGRTPDAILPFILILAVLVRLYWLISQTPVIENEGAYYARIAENLINGKGYVAIFETSIELWMPPLYPVLIGIFSIVFEDLELSGRLVSFIAGSSLVLPMYFISLQMYGRRVAILCAGLVAIHPYLISCSRAVSSESLYLTLMMTGVYYGLRSLDFESRWHPTLTGIWFGVAYLTRPEAFVLPFAAIVALVAAATFKKTSLKNLVSASVLIIGPFLLLASPYIAFLSYQTGQLRFEGKSSVNQTIGRRMNSGMSMLEAGYGVDERLENRGPFLKTQPETIHSARVPSAEYLAQTGARTLRPFIAGLVKNAHYFGVPILTALALLGFWGWRWELHRLVQEGLLLLLFVIYCLILVSHPLLLGRHMAPLLPILLIWSAKGTENLSQVASELFASINPQRVTFCKKFVKNTLALGLVSSLTILSFFGIRAVPELRQAGPEYKSVKEAGLWLRNYMPGTKKIMDTDTAITFYAGGAWTPYPYAGADVALKYIQLKKPDFLILYSASAFKRPFLHQWLDQGIPDENAKLVYSADTNLKIRIYAWNHHTP